LATRHADLVGAGMFFKPKNARATTGRLGEAWAIDYLVRQGYEIIETNYRRPFGEVDIIAREQGALVFIEVKTRRSRRFGGPSEAVDGRKQRQLSRIAQHYLAQHRLGDSAARFDVVGVILDAHDQPVEMELIRDAFESIG